MTQASRYPLLIDPQGQAMGWIKSKEKMNMPLFGVTALNNPQLKDQLEFCMQEVRKALTGHKMVVRAASVPLFPRPSPCFARPSSLLLSLYLPASEGVNIVSKIHAACLHHAVHGCHRLIWLTVCS